MIPVMNPELCLLALVRFCHERFMEAKSKPSTPWSTVHRYQGIFEYAARAADRTANLNGWRQSLAGLRLSYASEWPAEAPAAAQLLRSSQYGLEASCVYIMESILATHEEFTYKKTMMKQKKLQKVYDDFVATAIPDIRPMCTPDVIRHVVCGRVVAALEASALDQAGT